MGHERRSEKLKDTDASEDPARARRRDDDVADQDIAHADRQMAMRMQPKGKGERAGFVDDESVDHMFAGVGDQYAASAEMGQILDRGVPVAGLVPKVANLDATRREEVARRIADVAKAASGNEVLQIGDLVGLPPTNKIRAALVAVPPPTTNALRAHAMELSIEERISLLDDKTRKLLESHFTEPAQTIPGIAELGAAVRKHPELVGWYLRTTPPRVVALAMMRMQLFDDERAEIAAIFNGIGRDAWKWALELDVAAAQLMWNGNAGDWAKLTTDKEAAKHLESLPTATTFHKGNLPGGSKRLRDMVPAHGVDVAAVVAALQEARSHEHYLDDVRTLTASPYRERLIAAATLDQIEMMTNVFSLDTTVQLEWYLNSPLATVEAIRPITTAWPEGSVESVGEHPKLVGKLMAKFPAAGPTDFFGHKARALYPLALKNAAVRKWCTVNADPRDLFELVTQKTPQIATMWRAIIADGVAADWYKGLGTGVGGKNDERLRMLALGTPDLTASSWIRNTLLGDYVEDKVNSSPMKVDAVAYESNADERFHAGLQNVETQDLGQRTSELSADEVAKLHADPAALAQLLPRLHDPWLLRNLMRIQPVLATVLAHANLLDKGLPAYIRQRPSSELVAAFQQDDIELRVTGYIHTPFETFPALREPAVLAQVLTRPTTLKWLLEREAPGYVMSLLAHPVAGKAAAKLFGPQHLALIPDVMHRKEERAAVEKFAAFLHEPYKSDVMGKAEDPADYEDEEDVEEQASSRPPKAPRGGFKREDVQARHDELDAALATGDLRKGLDIVLTDPVSLQNVLAVCRERHDGAAKLLGQSQHEATVKKLKEAVGVSPLALFPSLPYYAYFHTPTARTWLFESESAIDILKEMANEPQLAKLILDKLDASSEKDTSIAAWLARMPKGTALTAQEQNFVKRMFDSSHSAIAARKLFEIRFGTTPSSTFTKEELTKVWQMFELVPDAHIEMGAVHGFTESKTLGGYSGLFSPGDQRIDIEDNLVNAGKPNTMFDQKMELTREQLIAAYGYDDQQIKARVAAGQIDEKTTAKGLRYVIKPVTTKLLDTTVLHEIGHAVDHMLGERTELVYGLAGWKEFGESDIDELAKDLGGWDRVKPTDQERIKDAWAVWLNSRTDDGLDKFIPDDHPALADKYKGVGIVDLGRRKESPSIFQGPMNGRYTIVSHKYQRFYRVPEKTRNAAPSSYSMTAPAEWFAECYAEYYRTYEGPGTEANKGGQLAGWIKNWFTENIDNLKYNPSRRDR